MSRKKTVVERTYRARVEELWALWTTQEGFASWWGPEGFRADVHKLEALVGGSLHYDMVADTPEMVEAMRKLAQPASHRTTGTFTELRKHEKLVLTHLIDFLPGVKPYESNMVVEFFPVGDTVRMVVTLDGMHSEEFSKMQLEGFTSQLTKLDRRFGKPA